MTKEQILEQQVEALEKLLKLKQALVEELEAKVERMPFGGVIPGYYPGVGLPSIQPQVGQGIQVMSQWCVHEYPSMWGSTTPPPCLKCGQQSFAPTVTYSGAQGTTSNDPAI